MNRNAIIRRSAQIVILAFAFAASHRSLAEEVTVTRTNWMTETVTNVVAVEALRALYVPEYKTNLTVVTVTNEVAVDLVHTNVVDHWQTNWTAVTLTNWETVLVFRTNRIAQPITNIVLVDLSTNRTAAAA